MSDTLSKVSKTTIVGSLGVLTALLAKDLLMQGIAWVRRRIGDRFANLLHVFGLVFSLILTVAITHCWIV